MNWNAYRALGFLGSQATPAPSDVQGPRPRKIIGRLFVSPTAVVETLPSDEEQE